MRKIPYLQYPIYQLLIFYYFFSQYMIKTEKFS